MSVEADDALQIQDAYELLYDAWRTMDKDQSTSRTLNCDKSYGEVGSMSFRTLDISSVNRGQACSALGHPSNAPKTNIDRSSCAEASAFCKEFWPTEASGLDYALNI